MEDSLLDLLVHLTMTALLAAALCVASIVAAGALAFLVWAAVRVSHGASTLARSARGAYLRREQRPRMLALPGLRHRLRRP